MTFKMSRLFVAGAFAVAGVMATGAAQDAAAQMVAGPKVTWNVSIWGKKRAFSANIEALSAILSEKTGGNLNLKLVYGEALSPPKENIDGMKLGAFEAGPVCPAYTPGKLPASMALNLPFLPIPDLAVQKSVHEEFFAHPALVKEYENWGSLVAMVTLIPRYEFMGVSKPPTTLEGWNGLRVRALGGVGEAMKLLGAVPTSMPAPELFQALERGLVDVGSFPFSYAFGAYRLHEVAKWYTTNAAISTTGCPFLSGISAWNALPPQYQKLIEDSRDAALAQQAEAYDEADRKYIPLFKKNGIVAITYSKEERDRLVAIGGKPIWDQWVKDAEAQGIPGQELLDLILASAEKAAS